MGEMGRRQCGISGAAAEAAVIDIRAAARALGGDVIGPRRGRRAGAGT